MIASNPPAPPWYRAVSIALGLLGLFCLAMLLIDRGSTTMNLLPEGAWERGSVYTVTVWEILTGVCLLAFAHRLKYLEDRCEC